MRRIRITEEIKPNVFKGRIDETVHDRFVIDRLVVAHARGTQIIWDIEKPAAFDELASTLASGSGTGLPIMKDSGN